MIVLINVESTFIVVVTIFVNVTSSIILIKNDWVLNFYSKFFPLNLEPGTSCWVEQTVNVESWSNRSQPSSVSLSIQISLSLTHHLFYSSSSVSQHPGQQHFSLPSGRVQNSSVSNAETGLGSKPWKSRNSSAGNHARSSSSITWIPKYLEHGLVWIN